MGRQRIQKVLSRAGVASRRACEQMILDGRITVNGELVLELPCFVDPEADEVRVDGRPVRKRPERPVYYLLNKPRGVICTQSDPRGRPRAVDLIPEIPQRVFCVGRLDVDSTGLVLLTNDGTLTQRLTHPRFGVEKTYVVTVDGQLGPEQIERIKKGAWLDGRRTGGAAVKVLRKRRDSSLLELRLREGRNREVRRILAGLGCKVRRLKRTAIDGITDRGLGIGRYRRLKGGELDRLRRAGARG